jgi:exodeoxyribonuclease V alpha subunit
MLLRALLHFGDAEQIGNEIVLAAPTGRAAQRISEAVRNEIGSEEFEHADILRAIPSKTIHDLLRQSFSTELTFRHNATNILHYKTIIIDEASMIDNKLFESFLAAVDKNSRIVIVGDPQQLPSVNAGNMLQTLIRQFDGTENITHLTKTYRASGGVGDIYDITKTKQLLEQHRAAAPAEGKLNYDWDEKQKPYCFYDSASYTATDYVKAVRNWINKFINEINFNSLLHEEDSKIKILKQLEQAQALSVLRSGPEGCNYINEKLFEALCRHEKQRFPSFYPIIITANNSALGLTNGQMGIVLRGELNRYYAYFLDGEKIRSFPYENLPAFEKAYVITVHKSQGSQYKNVLLLLPSKGDSPLLTRSIVYTAVTRAKSTVTVLGGQAALDAYDKNAGTRITIWS